MPWETYWALILQIALASFVLFLPLGFLTWFLVRSAGFGIASVLTDVSKRLLEIRGHSVKERSRER